MVRAYMNRTSLGVHDRVVACGNTRDLVHGMPLTSRGRVKNVCAVAHNYLPTFTASAQKIAELIKEFIRL